MIQLHCLPFTEVTGLSASLLAGLSAVFSSPMQIMLPAALHLPVNDKNLSLVSLPLAEY